MRNAIRLGKIARIQIGLDHSWFIIFVLITWSLAGHYLMVYAGWSGGFRLALALVTALFFFGSILLHELGHSVVANALGTPVRAITLFIFGGVAAMTREPKRALHEFLIAGAGPLVSFMLAALFGLVWLLGRQQQILSVAAVGGWLASINLMLALFNLIPGFPLDGGRIFRSIVWGLTGNLRGATRIAAAVGQGVAWLFILLGVWQIFGGNWVNGLWIAFIGWFLNNAARSNVQQAALQDLLEGHIAREAMLTDCPHLPRRLTLDVATEQVVLPSGRCCFPVVEDGQLLGLVTVSSIAAVPQQRWPVTRVEDVMIPRAALNTVRPDDQLTTVFERMTTEDINQFPVMEHGRLLGMVSRDTLFNFLRARTEPGRS